jgi:hypothetical protein
VAVVGGYRDTEPAPGPAPGPVLAALAARTTVLPLTGLGPDAVGDLVADVVGEQRAAEVAAGVHRRTGGNPFFVQQVSWLLRSGQEGIPPGVHEAMELRFAALPGAAAAALRTAAVIGQRFSADLVALVSGQPSGAVAEALAVAVRARVVSRDGAGTYRFAHDLFREYADDQLPAAERASLHRRIGQGEAAGQAYLRAAGLARTGKDPAALARAALGLHAIGTRTWWPRTRWWRCSPRRSTRSDPDPTASRCACTSWPACPAPWPGTGSTRPGPGRWRRRPWRPPGRPATR